MKSSITLIKFLIYSNVFVSICVAALTHSTYIIYNLPKDNLPTILIMVFCFSFFTYNIQRFIKFETKFKNPTGLGQRLQWMSKQKKPLAILSLFFGVIGLFFTVYIYSMSFIVLIPMGILSIFYVIPIVPFRKNIPSLREIPYLKILIIGLVWSLTIVWLPFIDSHFIDLYKSNSNNLLIIPTLQVFLFIIAITLPFDIRDIDYDKSSHLKTIPQFLGLEKTIFLSEILLIGSAILLCSLDISKSHLYAILIAHIVSMIIIPFSNKTRKELFFAGVIEGLIIILYVCVIISEYFFSL